MSEARGPYAKTQARRADILRIALENFAERGFRSSSIREIAEQVGLSQAGLLHHFSSKAALLSAVLAERDLASIARFAGRTTGINILDALLEVVADNTKQPGLVRLFTTLSAEALDAEHPAHDFFQQRYRGARELLANALGEGQLRGQVAADVDVFRAASLLLAVQDGLQIQWLLDPSFDMLGAFETFLATFRQTIKA